MVIIHTDYDWQDKPMHAAPLAVQAYVPPRRKPSEDTTHENR